MKKLIFLIIIIAGCEKPVEQVAVEKDTIPNPVYLAIPDTILPDPAVDTTIIQPTIGE